MDLVESIVALAGMGVAVVFIGCVTCVILAWIRRGASRVDTRELAQEIAGLRDEVARLRERQGELILGLDTSVEHVERRLEARIQSQSREREAELVARRD